MSVDSDDSSPDPDRDGTLPSAEVAHQYSFGEDGSIEPPEGGTESDLEQYGVDIDNQEKETRYEEPTASSLLVDDRPDVGRDENSGDQMNLFPDVDEDQEQLSDSGTEPDSLPTPGR